MEVKLIVVGGKSAGKEILVQGPEFVVGRAEDCHLRPQSDRVSRRHTAIRIGEGLAAVRDLGSTNGTFVNDEKLEAERELKNGDHLRIGPLELEVELAVSVGGKRKPKVHNVQEAAARTVETAGEDELDISSWLNDDDEEEDSPVATKPADAKAVGATPTARQDEEDDEEDAEATKDETTEEEQEKKEPPKVVGQFGGSKKAVAESSRSAAEDMLKQFFKRE